MSTTMAVSLAYWMGCRKVRMLACDAVTAQDLRTVVRRTRTGEARFRLPVRRQAGIAAGARPMGMTLEWVAP